VELAELLLAAPNQGFGAWMMVEQAAGPRCQRGAPAAKRGRTTLTVGWRLLRRSPLGVRGWPGEGSTMRRGGMWLTARLMYAGWDRSSAIRRKVPWTKP